MSLKLNLDGMMTFCPSYQQLKASKMSVSDSKAISVEL